MPYRYRKDVVKAQLPRLQLIVDGQLEVQWNVDSDRIHTVMYQLREALAVAQAFPEDFPALARAAGQIRLRVVDGKITTQLVGTGPRVVGTATARTAQPRSLPQGQPPLTAEAIYLEWAGRQSTIHSMVFSLDRIENTELVLLYSRLISADVIMIVGEEELILSERAFHEANWGDANLLAWAPEHTQPESPSGFDFLSSLPVTSSKGDTAP